MDVLRNLCILDTRNPNHKHTHIGYKPDEIPEPRSGCNCDCCFYGRDQLAVRILELEDELAKWENEDEGDCPKCGGYLDVVDPSVYCPHCGKY